MEYILELTIFLIFKGVLSLSSGFPIFHHLSLRLSFV
ncbi:hypothetical protein CCA_00802 [Chlamydia caviae GPIC]|uniref:Uncharacterized protein n=1 Tax=Chlamydia caviae (strain ATCC VR-813 / DSM 19441 / 03DC25 / GPIC) TaxID=227941 RepID=Q821Y3_CHLCV|nr:hypothetical protein CCA_00802 [Chlamydia caviae GPIC]